MAVTSSRPRIRGRHRVQYNGPMSHADRAGVIAPPPLIYAAVFAVGYGLDRYYPVSLRPDDSAGWLGWAIFAAGLGVLALGGAYLNRAGTSVSPYRPTITLVTAGPYRYSRNPLYIALTLTYLGAAVVVNTVWPVMLLPGLLLVMQWAVISREERYLERRFGQEYRRYRARVRRWL
jgi:protein-S-isoprenylcysteine O-methyltransferase Ste14